MEARIRIVLILVLVFAVGGGGAICARAQMVSDTLFAWQGYARESTCRVRVYHSAPDESKPFTVVLGEIAENRGRTTLEDARLLVELVSREIEVDPEQAFWIFHWGSFSYPGADDSSKEVLFRATFRRNESGSVGSPSWRLIKRETVVAYTDRAFRSP